VLFLLRRLVFVPEPPPTLHSGKLTHNLTLVVRDVWATVRSRIGAIALVLCFLPLGTGAASNLWSAVSGDWHASADAVALATGVIAGMVMALGCLIGGWICDRMDRKVA
jgi:MFS transporter, PAT family, beta-lactamase induction signal transducer AmpG